MSNSDTMPSNIWKKDIKMRNLDDFYEEAHDSPDATFWSRSNYWLVFFSMGLANVADSTELGCMGFLLTNQPFIDDMLGGDISKYGALFTGSIFVGMLIGGILTGSFGDQNGRRPTLLLGLTLNSVSGFSAAVSPTISMICICRFIGGLGVGAVLASLIPLATEISPSSRRGAYVTAINSFMPIGGLTVGGLAMFMLTKWEMSWRLFMAACAIPSFLGLIMVYFFVPESARYLALEGKLQQAAKEANYIARSMGYNGNMLNPEELQYHFAQSQKNKDGSFSRKTFSEVIEEATNGLINLYSSDLRVSTISLQLLWFCIGSSSAFGTWILAIFEEVHISHIYLTLLLFWLANVPGLLAAGILIDKAGRKNVLRTSMICTFIFLLCFSRAAYIGADESDNGVIATSFMYHVFLVMSWTANGILTSETFPTKVRSTGLGVCTASARIATILAQYVNGALIKHPSKLLAVSSVPLLIGACALSSLEDTANKVLRDDVEQIELSNLKKNENHDQSPFVLLEGTSSKVLV